MSLSTNSSRLTNDVDPIQTVTIDTIGVPSHWASFPVHVENNKRLGNSIDPSVCDVEIHEPIFRYMQDKNVAKRLGGGYIHTFSSLSGFPYEHIRIGFVGIALNCIHYSGHVRPNDRKVRTALTGNYSIVYKGKTQTSCMPQTGDLVAFRLPTPSVQREIQNTMSASQKILPDMYGVKWASGILGPRPADVMLAYFDIPSTSQLHPVDTYTTMEDCYKKTNSMRSAIKWFKTEHINKKNNSLDENLIGESLDSLLEFFHSRVSEVTHNVMGIALSDVNHLSKKFDVALTCY
jgi:hypothetical protein